MGGSQKARPEKGAESVKLEKTKKVMGGLLAAMAAALVAGAVWANLFFAALAVVLLLVFISYSFSRWRCPHCGEHLGWVGKGIQLCPFCHERLDREA